MSDEDIIEQWIVQNIDGSVVPSDEGNGAALVYNMIMRLRGSKQQYEYMEEQDKFMEEICHKHKVDKFYD